MVIARVTDFLASTTRITTDNNDISKAKREITGMKVPTRNNYCVLNIGLGEFYATAGGFLYFPLRDRCYWLMK